MLAAQSANLKTALGLYWTARMGLPTLFFSADTDDFTMAMRATAMRLGVTQEEAEALIRAESPEVVEGLADLAKMRFVFESDPTYLDLELETAAYFEVHGTWPEVIVIDNLMNIVGQSEDEFGSMRDSTKALHRLTRITNASIFAMHHTRETEKIQTEPPPKSALQGKVSQIPEMILTLFWEPVSGELRVACVKSRFGPCDASGHSYTPIYADPSRLQFFNSRQAMQMGMSA